MDVPSVYAVMSQPVSQQVSQPVSSPATEGQSSAMALWLTVAVVLLLLLVAGLAAALGWGAHATRRLGATERMAREARGQIGELLRELSKVKADVTLLQAQSERVKSRLVTTGAQIASERVRSDRILDLLADLPPVDVVTSQEFRRAMDGGDG